MVNVASRAWYASVMENRDPIDAGRKAAELCRARRLTSAGGCRLRFAGDRKCDASNEVAKTSFNPRVSGGASPLVFTVGGCARRTRVHLTRCRRRGSADDAANRLRLRVVKRLHTLRQLRSAQDARASVAQVQPPKRRIARSRTTFVSPQGAASLELVEPISIGTKESSHRWRSTMSSREV